MVPGFCFIYQGWSDENEFALLIADANGLHTKVSTAPV